MPLEDIVILPQVAFLIIFFRTGLVPWRRTWRWAYDLPEEWVFGHESIYFKETAGADDTLSDCMGCVKTHTEASKNKTFVESFFDDSLGNI